MRFARSDNAHGRDLHVFHKDSSRQSTGLIFEPVMDRYAVAPRTPLRSLTGACLFCLSKVAPGRRFELNLNSDRVQLEAQSVIQPIGSQHEVSSLHHESVDASVH